MGDKGKAETDTEKSIPEGVRGRGETLQNMVI